MILFLFACLPVVKDTDTGGSVVTDSATTDSSTATTDSDSGTTETTSTTDSGTTGTTTDSGTTGTTGTTTDTNPDGPSAGDVVITEFMKNTVAVTDEFGEWFEIKNVSNHLLNLRGTTLRDAGTDKVTITSDLKLAAGSYAVLGLNGDSAQNGGYKADYVYDGTKFQLGNDADEIVLEYAGVVIDEVDYLDAPSWPDSKGYSLQLLPDQTTTTANDNVANWCLSSSTFGKGDYGTPGAENTPCPEVPPQ